MGTKNNPGKFDCYAKCGPDEPHFTLRAKDVRAPYLVRIWAALESGHTDEAVACFSAALAYKRNEGLSEKVREAQECAEAMRTWRTENT